MNRTVWFTLVLGLVVGLPGPLLAQRPAAFGQQWVRAHPFTLNAWEKSDVPPVMYSAAGFTSFIIGWDPSMLYPMYGHPWHAYLGALSLTQGVKDAANNLYTTYPNGLGWWIADEPNCDSPTSSDLLGVAAIANWLSPQFPQMLVYANVLGYSPSSMYKVDNYINAVHPDVLMYDYYPFKPGSEMYTNNFFSRAMNFRAKGLLYNLPVFAWVQTFKDDPPDKYRWPSESEHRLQMYSYLAMGYKGLSDFIYNGGPTNFTGLVTPDGVATPMYDIAAGVNPEISSLGNVLKFATTTAVRFIPGSGGSGHSTPSGLTNWSEGDGGDSHITNIQVGGSGSSKNGLIGFFNDDRGEELFLLVNEYCGSSLSASAAALSFSITFDASIISLLRLDQLSGQQVVVPLSNHVLDVTLPGGTGNLYKYDDGITFIPEPGTLVLLITGMTSALLYARRILRSIP